MKEARQFSHITKEIVEKGSIEIYSTEEDMIKLSEINLYNQYMKECRQKMRDLHILRGYYFLINSLTIFLIMFNKYLPILMEPQEDSVIIRFIIEIMIVAVYLFLCFWFCLWKGGLELVPNLIMTIILLFICLAFGVLLAFNVIYLLIYKYKKGGLAEEIGYPLFYDIRIDRIRKKTYDVQRKE